MVLLDLLGRRWTLRLIWELRDEPLSFRELRARADDVSPSVLSRRLAELRAAGITESGERGYVLSPEGRRLAGVLLELDRWAKRWAARR